MFYKKEPPFFLNLDFSEMSIGDCLTVNKNELGINGLKTIYKIAKKYGIKLSHIENQNDVDFFCIIKINFEKNKIDNLILEDIKNGHCDQSFFVKKYSHSSFLESVNRLIDNGFVFKKKDFGKRGRPSYIFTLA